MKLPSFSVRRPVATTMAYLAIVVLSVVALTKLSLDIMPEMTYPAITITTTYKGAGPEDVENQITRTIESMLGIVPGLKEIRSSSVENMSIVSLLFDWGVNLDEVANDVRARLEFAKRFMPSGAETPVLLKFDLSQMPVMFLTASADGSYGRLNEILNDDVAEPLKRVSGIGNVFVIGGETREIRVNVSRRRLEAYNVGIAQITQALSSHNLTIPAGDLNVGGQSFFLRLPAEYKNVREVGDTLIGNYHGRPIFLKDVADVSDSFAEPMMITRQEGKKSALMIIQKRAGANTVKVADGVAARLELLKKRLPPDVNLIIAYNLADDVKRTISSLTSSVLIGGLLVVLVTYLFLFNLRSSIVILVTIPISLVVSFLFLYLMGYTINIMSLSSIAIAIGMVVDNAIVVLENIVRRREEYGESAADAAVNGASEVGLAVSASTLTTVVVFLPLIFSGGLVGILFKQLGSVISITLLISLSISLTLSPMLAALVIKKRDASARRHPLRARLEEYMERLLGSVSSAVLNILKYALARRKKNALGLGGDIHNLARAVSFYRRRVFAGAGLRILSDNNKNAGQYSACRQR
ncbi:MAG: efflux RND transporter permease subunit [Endomicrobiia bacterium]|nr:efflux RND transporter permease subunit [Endomicrobiia bacterium]